MRVIIVGRGRVGRALHRAARESGLEVSLRDSRVQSRSFGTADLVLLAVSDAAISEVANRLASRMLQVRVLAHLSGSMGTAELAPFSRRGASTGVLHPMVSFASPSKSPTLTGATFVIGGDAVARRTLVEFAQAIDARPLVKEIHGPAYHAAAALAANGTAALAHRAANILMALGLSAREARTTIAGLLRTVADNVENIGTPEALTGPISRGDIQTVEKHLTSLNRLRSGAKSYRQSVPIIVDVARESGLRPSKARALSRLVRERS